MSAAVDNPELADNPVDLEEVRWRAWPIARRPRLAIVSVVASLAAGIVVAYVAASAIMACIAVVALGLSAWRAFVPIDFTLDNGGVDQRCIRGRRYDDWSAFRTFTALSDGFILWPTEDPCPLDAMHGLFLPCSKQREEVLAILRRRLAEVS